MEHGDAKLQPKFPGTPLPDRIVFLNVDGGVINNNPFDYAQFALMGAQKAGQTASSAAHLAVLMVSPFPELPAFLPEGQPPAELVAVIRALFPALINQARFKASELVPALDPNDCSRFLIAPHRAIGDVEQRYKIACGLLGGFGGFLDEKFRAHDFQLGRRNCQEFLRSHFGLTPDNRILQDLKDQKDFELSEDTGKYRIIPRLGDAYPEVALPKWPRMNQTDFDLLMRRIKGRLGKVAPRLVQAQTASRFFRALGRLGLWLGQDRVLEFVRLAILSDLVRRDQIEGWELPSEMTRAADDIRLVLAELASPAFTFRTAEGIARKTHLDRGFVADVIEQLQKVDDDKPYQVWKGRSDGQQVFTLTSRKPSWFGSLPGIKQARDLLEAPAID